MNTYLLTVINESTAFQNTVKMQKGIAFRYRLKCIFGRFPVLLFRKYFILRRLTMI